MTITKTTQVLSLAAALLTLYPSPVLAGDYAIRLSGTVVGVSPSAPAPFSGAEAGDPLEFHISCAGDPIQQIAGFAEYAQDSSASWIQVDGVTIPVTPHQSHPLSGRVTLLDGPLDSLQAIGDLSSSGAIFNLFLQDSTGTALPSHQLSTLVGHVAGPFAAGSGTVNIGDATAIYLLGTIDRIEFTADSGGGPFASTCFGDGSAAPCPCGNGGAPGAGCRNSSGSGCVLGAVGVPSVVQDQLTFQAAQLPPNRPGLLFSGTAESAIVLPFGDGLRCVGGQVQRLGTTISDAAGTATWGPGLATAGSVSHGDSRFYQAWYRDGSHSTCSSGFNLSQAVRVTWEL